jgi:hypothetical protein
VRADEGEEADRCPSKHLGFLTSAYVTNVMSSNI